MKNETIETRTTFAVDDAPHGPIRITGLALPWDTTVRLNWWGDTVSFSPGSVDVANPRHVKHLLDHRLKPFGYGLEFESRDAGAWGPAGLYGTVAVPRDELADPDVDAAVRQMRNGVRDAWSVGVTLDDVDEEYDKGSHHSHVTVTRGTLLELSSVVIPRFSEARIQTIAAGAGAGALEALIDAAVGRRLAGDQTSDEPAAEPDDDDETEGDDVSDTETDETPDAEASRLAQHRRATMRAVPDRPAISSRYATFGAYARAKLEAGGAWDEGYERRVQAALVDTTTGDIPGLLPEAWLREIVDLMGSMAPTIAAFRSRPLPDSGMIVNVPQVTSRPTTGVQTAEKTDIASAQTTITPGSFSVDTYAGGEDISIQALLRSDPSYFDEVMRLYAGQMAGAVNAAALDMVLRGATAGPAWPAAATGINQAFVDAAVLILNALKRFPEVAILSSAAWAAMGGAVDTDGRPIFPTVGLWNPVGTLDVTVGTGNVRGLTYYVDPSVNSAVTWAVVGVRDAFLSMQGPIGTLTADVPAKLGRDVAVYRFASMGILDQTGLIRIGAAPVAAAAESSSGSSSKAAK